MTRPPETPTTLQEWLWRVKRYEQGIFVREKGQDGSWGAVALSSLPPDRWAYHVARFLESGALPARVREPEELNKNPAARTPDPTKGG